MKISKYNFLTLLFFFISPILGLISSLFFVFKNNSVRFFNFIVSLFFSVIVIKNPPLFDLYRYYNQYLYIENFNFLESRDFFVPFLMYLFKILDIPFYFFPAFILFLTVYFILSSFYLFFVNFNIKIKNYILGVLVLIIFMQPISISIGLRSYLSYAFFIYGVAFFYFNCKKKGWVLFVLSCLTHISSIYLVLIFLISRLYKLSKFNSLIFGFFLIFLSNSLLPILLSYFPVESVRNYFFTWYIDRDDLYAFNTINDFLMVFIPIFIGLFLYIQYVFYHKTSYFSSFFKIENFISLLFLGLALVSMSPAAISRYFYVFNILIFICLLSSKTFPRGFIFAIVNFLLIFIMFFTHNVNIPKRSLYYGEPVKQALFSPFFMIIYSRDDYDKFLTNIDDRGYLKEDKWERNR